MSSESKIYDPTLLWPEFKKSAHLSSMDEYRSLYLQSIQNPDSFWADQAEKFLVWDRKWNTVSESRFDQAEVRWFVGGKLNLTRTLLDKNLTGPMRNKAALIWEGDDPEESRTYTYQQLHREVCRIANVLKKQGVKKGDRVTLYLPMIPELAMAVLACARIGAVHSVIFGGFSAEAIKDRILDSGSTFVITSDGGYRGGKLLPMKQNVDLALNSCPEVRTVLVVKRTGHAMLQWHQGRDLWLHEELESGKISDQCPAESMDSEDPLFILYTSGSTGKPKGVLHTIGGYGVYAAMTSKYIFDLKQDDTFFCTADIGWVTGHSYLVYGPLLNGATCVMFEGVPNYPDVDRFWNVVDKHGVTIFYSSPTAIRSLMRCGEEPVNRHRLITLRLLGSVGEPINPEAWRWYYRVVGKEKCPIVDTWWQTETGGILISALPGVTPLKPGSATLPFFGVQPLLVDENGKEIQGPGSGNLCIRAPWPSIMRGVYGNPSRFKETYFSTYPGYYFTGDGCARDQDGYYWITGRVDDVLNVSGHRLSTAEIESALVLHPSVAEAAVVGAPHEIKGQAVYAYVTLKQGFKESHSLKEELRAHVAREISAIAKPEVIQWAPGLPKTRSGKIMRRILRKIACGELDSLGDTTTLADPQIVQVLIEHRENA